MSAKGGGAMAASAWKVSGQYYETCNCDFICPCLPGQMAVSPSKGSCNFAMAFQVDRGSYGSVSLDGLGFIVLGFTPEAMGKGNWSVGLIADERTSVEQRDAITAIASGAAGGPMAALSGLIGKFLGVELAPIRVERDRMMAAMGMPMNMPWRPADFFFTFAMWAVMMVGMMAPSAAPMLLLFAAVRGGRGARGLPLTTLAFALAYIAVWASFSVGATA